MMQNNSYYGSMRSTTASGNTRQRDHPLPILPLYKEFIALFTGQWPEGYRPRWKRTPWWHLLTMLVTFLGGLFLGSLTASSVISTESPALWPLLGLAWMLIVHSARKAQLVLCHYAVHGNMTGQKWGDRVLVELLSTLLLIQHFEGYYQDHVRTHHSLHLATLQDPDMQFMLALGFRPGMSKKALWRRLYWTIVSPRFHWLFLWMRLRVNFTAAPLYRRVMSCVYAAAIVLGLSLTQGWLLFVVVWIVPIFPGYHVAALLQFVTEHRWLQGDASSMREAEEG